MTFRVTCHGFSLYSLYVSPCLSLPLSFPLLLKNISAGELSHPALSVLWSQTPRSDNYVCKQHCESEVRSPKLRLLIVTFCFGGTYKVKLGV